MTLFKMTDGDATAEDTAREFARTWFDTARKVETWVEPDYQQAAADFMAHGHMPVYRFQLAHGTRWYDVEMAADGSGWEVS